MFNWLRKKRKSSRTLREHWAWHQETSRDAFRKMLAEPAIWPTWHLSRNPEQMAALEFNHATVNLCGGADRELADEFVSRTADILDRIDDEDKLQSEHCVSSYPVNAGTALMLRGMIELYRGRAPTENVFAEAARHYIEYASNMAGDGMWDALDQYKYLFGIELFLLADRPDEALAARKRPPRPLNRNARQRAAIDDILGRIESGQGACENFASFFRSVRDPRIMPLDYEFYSCDIEPVMLSLLSLRLISERKLTEIAWMDVVSHLVD